MFFEDITKKIDGQSSCIGKVQYSKDSAHKAAIRMSQKKNEPFEAYLCRHAPPGTFHWHIGHPRFWSLEFGGKS